MALTVLQAKYEKARRLASVDLLAFLRWAWWMPHPLVVGRHTKAICDRLTRATEDWREGKTTYLLIAVPFRHGKSDIVSRSFPAWFLGRNADRQPDVILSGYGADLVHGFSRTVKQILVSEKTQAVFPGIKPARHPTRNDTWQIDGSMGVVTAQGLGGSLTGKGGHVLIVDDYCKNREEARSITYRNKVWDGFRNDMMTRRNAPASIVIVCATPWHVDDLRGRIKRAMVEEPGFPQFEELSFPARKDGQWDYLFPERFTPEWYESQRAALQKQAAAMLDCEPMVEGGNRFAVNNVKVHHTLDGWPVGRESRGWDVASSSVERDSDDPDATCGVRGLVRKIRLAEGAVKYELWIRSIVWCKAEATERNALIRATARADGPGVSQHVEAFGGYKDAFTTIRDALKGVCIVKASHLSGDKSAKLAPLEPCFEAGDVHVYAPGCGPHLDTWLSEFSAFPDGSHDDCPDGTAVMYHSQVVPGGSGFLY